VANAFLNNVNQNTPQGSLNYDVTGSYEWTDPSTGSKYSIPRFTSTQSLNATQQALQDTSDATKQTLGNIGYSQAQKIGGILGTPFSPGAYAPGAGNAQNILNTPQADADAFRQSSPIYFAEGLKGALLIAHGMVDTNVFFQDTVRLTQRLVELRKENWSVAMYPVENHGFVRPESWADEYKRIFKLFEDNLKK